MQEVTASVVWLESVKNTDVGLVGGKNASLGEMIQTMSRAGVRVPDGFATTANAYWRFLDDANLRGPITDALSRLTGDTDALHEVGASIRAMFLNAEIPAEIADAIGEHYRELCERAGVKDVDVAVRSSATAEDLPNASFAGQQDTYLNIVGVKALLDACRRCYASLFTDRAIAYRIDNGFDHLKVALSIGVQRMVRSDLGGSGVMFSLDTDTGFPDVVIINAAWGLGENVVQGAVTPDQYTVFKPLLDEPGRKPVIEKICGEKALTMRYDTGRTHSTRNVPTPPDRRAELVLNDDQILELAGWARAIEAHYDRPMDMEWALDGRTDELYLVQARPETVQSRKSASVLKNYTLRERGRTIVSGVSVGSAIATGKVCRVLHASDIDQVEDGSILVTEMTDPDWVPIMTRVAAIVTDEGGRTCHAAIVSRELGIPAIVGTGSATELLSNGDEVTVSCAEGDVGNVYEGRLAFDEQELDLEHVPETRTRIMMNIGSPPAASRWWRLPCHGIGLARMEFIINNIIKIHPMALVRFDTLEDKDARREIQRLTSRYADKREYFIDKLAQGIAKIAATQWPDPVIVRTSDFKTNEYANLIGGSGFEPSEDNPMIGFRGASRYYSDRYREAFALECEALRRVREDIGLTNVVVMIPFCRTLSEADRVLEEMAGNGLRRGENGLEVYVMCEIPANVILASEFSERFDGFSIGTNDLTQLVLGVDRDSADLAYLFDERNEAVKEMIRLVIERAHEAGRKVGLCGQAPSDHPEFARFLVECGIDSISVNPDSVLRVIDQVAQAEKKSAVAV